MKKILKVIPIILIIFLLVLFIDLKELQTSFYRTLIEEQRYVLILKGLSST